MSLTELEKKLVAEELDRNGGRAGKCASVVGVPLIDVVNFQRERQIKRLTPGEGRRPELVPHIIASKHVNDIWPDTEAIACARIDYDNGLVDLCQWREGDIFHLLRLPRRVKDYRRRAYFSRTWEEEPPHKSRRRVDHRLVGEAA